MTFEERIEKFNYILGKDFAPSWNQVCKITYKEKSQFTIKRMDNGQTCSADRKRQYEDKRFIFITDKKAEELMRENGQTE